MREVSMTVNGLQAIHVVEDRTLLVHFLRDHMRFTGTHVGCDTTQCGACTVLVDGHAVKSCTILAAAVQGCHVTTIEGLGQPEDLHPMQRAFNLKHGLQCGFCTPGMVMAAVALVRQHNGELDERSVREGLEGNICRCTGYQTIVEAVLAAAQDYRQSTWR